ncbi:MAG TPA: TolC family protein [Flavobacterium sp.]|jgi:outer membrane protein TolC
MKQSLILILFLYSICSNSQEKSAANQTAQEYTFTLEQAISHAITNNYSAINASRDIEIAQQKKRETTATGLPQINAGIDYTNNIEIPLSVVPAQFFNEDAPEGTFAAVAFSPKQTVNARATLSQLIFDGSYIVALQASKTYLKYYENAKRKTDVEIRDMVINSYGNVLLAEESIIILTRNKSILEKTLNDTRETFKNGLIEEENVEQLEITLGTLNSNLNNSLRVLDISRKMLNIALGVDIDSKITLTDKLDRLTMSNLAPSATTGEFNVSGNIDYLIAQNFTEQRTLELKLQKSRALPSLSANLNVGYNAFNQNFEFLNKGQQYYDYATMMVSLNIPIFSGFGRSARTQQARIALDQAQTQLTETEQRLKLQYESARSEYEFSIEQYNTAKNNLALAERIERKQQIKFTEGLSSSFDFSEAQRQLYAAQQTYLQSMINIITRRSTLESVTNQ